MTLIATWNVNSIRARLPRVLDWLSEAKPDVALLQELKVVDESFPAGDIEDLGYNIATHGQKTYNGVAILSKFPIEDISRGLPGDDSDEQARYIEAVTGGVRVASIYLPNGNPAPGEKFDYKIAWMDRLLSHARELIELDEAFVLGGDYNVCVTDDDVYDPAGWADDALCRPESRNRFRALTRSRPYQRLSRATSGSRTVQLLGLHRRGVAKGFGLLIDHLLLSPQAADRLMESGIDRKPRGKEKPSDHTPVWCNLKEA